jgi:hypothetical protein
VLRAAPARAAPSPASRIAARAAARRSARVLLRNQPKGDDRPMLTILLIVLVLLLLLGGGFGYSRRGRRL